MNQSQYQLSRENLPLVSVAHSMATHSTALALLVPHLIETSDKASFRESYQRVDRNLQLMELVPARIDAHSGYQASRSRIELTVSEIKTLFAKMAEVIVVKLDTQQTRSKSHQLVHAHIVKIKAFLNEAIALQTEKIFLQSETLQSLSGNQGITDSMNNLISLNLDNEVLFNLANRVAVLGEMLEVININSNSDRLKDVKSRVEFQFRLLVSETVSLASNKDKSALGILLTTLYKMLLQAEGLLSLHERYNVQLLELGEFSAALQEKVFQLASLTAALVTLVEENTSSQAEAAVSRAELGTRALFVIALLSLIVSVVAIWGVVIRRILNPLIQLAKLMRDVSTNNTNVDIPDYALVELNEIAKALRVFRNNSLALEQHQQSLQSNNHELTRVNEDLKLFAHVASHDLKSPLRSLQILTEFIDKDIRTGHLQEAGDNLGLLQKRVRRLHALLDSLLKYTLADGSPGDVGEVNITALIRETFSLIEGHDRFTLTIPDNLPLCSTIESDLSSVFLNLLKNAIRHHDRDSGTIMVKFNESDDSYIFEVSDDGPGIDPKYHQKVFEILQTIKSKDVVEGSGVGLAHVRRLIESRGGNISVMSNPATKRGSRFIFYYPKLQGSSK